MHPVFTMIVVFLTITIVPIGQEVFLRHHLYARMSAAGSGVKGALISSCLPGLFLAALPSAALMLFAQGLASCWLYKKTGRLLVPILLSATITACFFALDLGMPGDMDSWLQETMSQLLK
jgi:membrane protease YdiL (CAAX protease family)